jgi:hypothetical protein
MLTAWIPTCGTVIPQDDQTICQVPGAVLLKSAVHRRPDREMVGRGRRQESLFGEDLERRGMVTHWSAWLRQADREEMLTRLRTRLAPPPPQRAHL